jgi:hypothetical protein
MCTAQVDTADLAACVVAVEHRRAGLPREPPVAPADHDHQEVDELGALLGQDVLEPGPPVVGAALEHPLFDEMIQPLGQDLARDPEVGLDLLESHRPVPGMSDGQTLVTTGIEDAVAVARDASGDKDVALMGGGVATAALAAGLVDEVILHQVPILLGGGRPFFQSLPEHVRLRLVEAVPAPGVTHLRYEVVR